jgi:hypothetical protein
MPKRAGKSEFPVSRIERDLEPGPSVPVSPALGDGRNIAGNGGAHAPPSPNFHTGMPSFFALSARLP